MYYKKYKWNSESLARKESILKSHQIKLHILIRLDIYIASKELKFIEIINNFFIN